MHQKNIKYLLLIGVTLIWGSVLYRLLAGMNENSSLKTISRSSSKVVISDSNLYQPYTLINNYTDPFGADDNEINISSSSSEVKNAVEPIDKFVLNKTVDISFIKYKGLILNPKTHKKAAIISINDADEFARLNDRIKNIKINAITTEKINVTYLDKKYWIKRQ